MCSRRALLSTCSLSCWSVVIPALLSYFRPISGFVSRFGYSRSMFGLAVGAYGLEFTRAVRSSVHVHCFCSARGSISTCFFIVSFCCTQLVFRLRTFSYFVLFCVARSLCFSMAACFHVWHVLCEHMANESP